VLGLPPWFGVVVAFVVAVGLALYLAPIIIRAALRYGIVDKPKPPLKEHQQPVPYLGGMVVFVAFLGALAVTFPFDQTVLAILLCASIVVSVGLIDDLGTLVPKDKLIGQVVAAIVLVKAGVAINLEALPSPIDEVVSVLWLVTCMNAFNILDVSDGLAATAALIGALGALVVALLNGAPMVATMAASLAGGSLGFLHFNRQPARMYLGDTGSMFLGTILGALAICGRYSTTNVVSSWFVPLALVALPLFDLTLVVLARLRARRPIWQGSPDHFAVRLRHAGWTPRGIARVAGGVGAVVIAVSIGSTFLEDFAAAAVLAGVAATLLVLLLVILVRLPPRTGG
jgi:UDP-GlcNAc:undecaprenyl-phosphate GlcNAc-1-phosphate transferase